jgi:phenol 2-monooxygenase (NADPH)
VSTLRTIALDKLTPYPRVYVDDVDVTEKIGGKAYEAYGVGENGAIIIVRPDGYIGAVLPLDKAGDVEQYFTGFTSSI